VSHLTFRTLPSDEFLEVLTASSDKSRDVFVGGVVDRTTGTLALVRGTLDWLIVPLTIFRPSGRLTPDFHRFEPCDYGRTLRFGDYEATADVVLWEMDSEYRKRVKAKERAQTQGFGPALRRLRTQRGLSQSDFPGIARKTISRIENGEVEKPHGATLDRIAKVLGVASEDIETY
jgi:DNA-binding XRE family transcriptional regulator